MHDTTTQAHEVEDEGPRASGRALTRVHIPPTAHRESLVPDGGSPGIGHSVWLPPAAGPSAPALNETALPTWALTRIAAQFVSHGGSLGISHGPSSARTALEVAPTTHVPDWFTSAERYGPDEALPSLNVALVIADPIQHEPSTGEAAARRFWRALSHSVGPGGLVLVHSRQIHNTDGMHDPCGHLVIQARAAGLAYIQHHVLVHTRLLREPLSAADHAERRPPHCAGAEPAHRQVHTDLLAFLV